MLLVMAIGPSDCLRFMNTRINRIGPPRNSSLRAAATLFFHGCRFFSILFFSFLSFFSFLRSTSQHRTLIHHAGSNAKTQTKILELGREQVSPRPQLRFDGAANGGKGAKLVKENDDGRDDVPFRRYRFQRWTSFLTPVRTSIKHQNK